MKKFISLALALGMLSTAVPTAFAEDKISVEINGSNIEFDVQPEIINDRVMVPLRKIFEEIGAYVKWDGDTETVTARKNSKTISFKIGSNEIQIDTGKTDSSGNAVTETVALDVPAQIVSGRTLVPTRAISECMGYTVDWDDSSKTVSVTSDDEDDDSWKANEVSINLSDTTSSSDSYTIDGSQIKISEGGDYTLTGELSGGITVSTDDKVKLRLAGVEITSNDSPCIYVENADKAYITISDDTENYLVCSGEAEGAVYSKDNLEIKGDGSLSVEASNSHGIKVSDNLTIESGKITINASSDGLHVNDTLKIKGGELDITAVGDGIDSESIINITDGTINIETNGEPTATQTPTPTENTNNRFRPNESTNDVEFENSTKGIAAEWMMVVSGGDISVNSASHAVHCADDIEISGGSFELSSKYDKGISAHGDLTISGDSDIDVKKSTEGLESKNVLTVNGGTIKVVASDDAINATGGNSGEMFGMPQGDTNQNGDTMRGGGRRGTQNTTDDTASSDTEGNGQGGMTPPDMGGNGQGGMTPPNMGGNGQGGMTPPNMGGNGQGGMTPPDMGGNGQGDMTPPNMGGNGQDDMTPPDFGNGEQEDMTPPDFGNGEQEGMTPPDFGNGEQEGMTLPGRNADDMKTCLIINDGYFELTSGDDCLDANGNMQINGGTIKATYSNGAFTGNFAIIDPDGKTTIGENANLIFAAGSGSDNSLSMTQNEIVVYCESKHSANDKITVTDESGNVVYEYAPTGSYSAVLIASKKIETGKTYVVSMGDETYTAEISQQKTVFGTKSSGDRQAR